MGPVADDIKDAVSNSYGLTIASVTADLAEFISKRK
jgi:hypothetical protein